MGFQYILSSHTEKKRDMGERADESGQLSLDFLVGFSVFMLTLIIASSMLSGVLVGLQSKKIDYDAVAYRTGVILVEDPGEPSLNWHIRPEPTLNLWQWEFIGSTHKNEVLRFGLSQYKGSPKVLSHKKIETFFNQAIYSTPWEYRNRIIFGDYPYNFNITLQTIPPYGTSWHIGDPYPDDTIYGYIRRVVLVKNTSFLLSKASESDMSAYNNPGGDGQFDIHIRYFDLVNETKGSKYWVDPMKEGISFKLDVSGIKDPSAPKVRLNSVSLHYYEPLDDEYPPTGTPLFISIDGEPPIASSSLPVDVSENISMELPPGFLFEPSSFYGDVRLSHFNISFQFDPTTAQVQNKVPYPVLYQTLSGYRPPELEPAVLEVRVW